MTYNISAEQIGVRKGQRALLLILLKSKFGTVSDSYLERMRTASEKEIVDWGKKIIAAKTIEQLFDGGFFI